MSNVSVFPNSVFVAILHNITMENKDWLYDINNICVTTNLYPLPLTALSLSLLSCHTPWNLKRGSAMRILCPSSSNALPSAFRGSGHRNSLPKQPHLMTWRTLAGGGKREAGQVVASSTRLHPDTKLQRLLELYIWSWLSRSIGGYICQGNIFFKIRELILFNIMLAWHTTF